MNTIPLKRNAILGVFITAGLVLIVLAILTIGSQQKVFEKTLKLRISFDNVEGLQPGNNVWLSGLKIGTVKRLALSQNNHVEVLLALDRKVQSHIYKDTRAKISSDGLIGNRIVVLSGGAPENGPVADNDLLQNEKTVKTEDMLATLQENNKNLLEITGHIKQISQTISEGKGPLGMLLTDSRLADDLHGMLANLRAASRNTRQLTSDAQQYTAGLNKPGGLANSLMTDTQVFSEVRTAVSRIKEAAANADQFSANLDLAGQQFNKPNTPAGLFLQDQQVANDLRETIAHLRTSSEKLDQDLEALQHNFLFRGYFRKKEKAAKAAKSASTVQQ